MIQNPKIVKYIKEDRSFSSNESATLRYLLDRILTGIDPVDGDAFAALKEDISGSSNLMDLAVQADNKLAIKWIFDFINEKTANNDCDSRIGIKCF